MFVFAYFAVIAAAVALAVSMLPSKAKERLGKATALVAVVVLFTVIFGGVFYGALAEDLVDVIEVDEFVSIEPALFNEKVLLIVSFEYHGEILSWYEEGCFYPTNTYLISVFNGVEVIDVQILSEEVNP